MEMLTAENTVLLPMGLIFYLKEAETGQRKELSILKVGKIGN